LEEVVRGVMGKFGSDRERRHRGAETLYELEMLWLKEGTSEFVYHEEHDLFRFPGDRRFAFSKEWAGMKLLEKRGYYG
jgi:hypothetical protein